MDLYNMQFRDFIKQDSRRMVKQPPVEEPEFDEELNEEYQEPVRKPVNKVPTKKVIEEEYDEPDEDLEYYAEDEYYEEPVQQVHKPVQRPVQRPVQHAVKQVPQRVVRTQRPSAVQQYRQYNPGYALPENQFRRPLTVTSKQLKETTIEGTANSLTEAIKRKVDTVFYRFGIQGLEKLDEKILDTIEELQYPEQKITRRPLKEMRRVPARKPVKKPRPITLDEIAPVPQPVYEEPVYEEPIYEEQPVYEEQTVDEVTQVEENVEEINEPVKEVIPPPKPAIASPKPAFLQTKKEDKKPVIESTGDEDEDLINAVKSIDFNEGKEDPKPVISDEELWGTVEAILETQPQQELVHEPQTTSCLHPMPIQTEQKDEQETPKSDEETITETVTETVTPSKPKKKRKVKQTVEVTNTNEEK